jgi:hypothetical protein
MGLSRIKYFFMDFSLEALPNLEFVAGFAHVGSK